MCFSMERVWSVCVGMLEIKLFELDYAMEIEAEMVHLSLYRVLGRNDENTEIDS